MTKFSNLLLVFLYVLSSCSVLCYEERPIINRRPIIGVLAGEIADDYKIFGSSMISASYVKFLESGGARVAPLMIYRDKEYYEEIMKNISGVLLPGGSHLREPYGEYIFNIATEMNKEGDYFPLWGTCLGFEKLILLAANNKSWLTDCSAEDMASNINFVDGFKPGNTNLFKRADPYQLNKMRQPNVNIHYHKKCLTPDNYKKSGLDEYFNVLAENNDTRKIKFVDIIEAKKFPYYGVSFHPEKAIFEWVDKNDFRNIPHNDNATIVTQYFANFFVNETRKNNHKYYNKTAENEVLIYNYKANFTGKKGSSVTQYYFFE